MSTDQNTRTSTDRSNEPAWLLVTRREVVSRITDKSFLIGTALMVAADRRLHRLQRLAGRRRPRRSPSAATPDAVAMATAIKDGAPAVDDKVEVTLVELDDEAAAETALREDEVDAWLHPTDDGWQLTSESSEQESLTDVTRGRRTPAGPRRERRRRRHDRRGARGRQHRVDRLPAR